MAATSGLNNNVRRLVESAIMIALASILSIIPFYKMPLGGSMTLASMLPIMIIAYKYGVKWGLFTGFCYAIIQLLIDAGAVLSWGLTWQAVAGSFTLDYILAFTSLGLAGIYGKGFARFMGGMTTAVAVRFICHVVSGVIIFSSYAADKSVPAVIRGHVFLYSAAYNGAFLLPDLILCLVVGAVIFKPLGRFLND